MVYTKIPKRNTSIYKKLKTAEQRNRGENMSKPISARIDDELYKLIEQYAASRGLNFTQALITMLESKDVIILEEGVEILNCLNDIAYYLQNIRLPDKSQKRNIREVCDELWQLLDSLTRKTAEMQKEDIL